jgi:hypothetical protein
MCDPMHVPWLLTQTIVRLCSRQVRQITVITQARASKLLVTYLVTFTFTIHDTHLA